MATGVSSAIRGRCQQKKPRDLADDDDDDDDGAEPLLPNRKGQKEGEPHPVRGRALGTQGGEGRAYGATWTAVRMNVED